MEEEVKLVKNFQVEEAAAASQAEEVAGSELNLAMSRIMTEVWDECLNLHYKTIAHQEISQQHAFIYLQLI